MWTAEKLTALADTKPRELVPIVLDLQARLALNSSNSSKPPSSDGYTKPAPKSERPKTGLPSGGQKGHAGHTLKPVEKPDHVIEHPLDVCSCGCGGSLREQPVLRHETRQVFELPARPLEVTEHRAEVKRCPRSGEDVCAPFPPGVEAPVQYGVRFFAWLVYCNVYQLLPLYRLRQMCRDLFGQAISQATILTACKNVAAKLHPFRSAIKRLLMLAAVVNTDETGLRVAGKLHWLHVLCTPLLTWFDIHPKKNFDILAAFRGRLIHDCLISYFGLTCKHGLCGAHLLRELTFIFEQFHQPWAGQLHDLLLEMSRFVEQQKAAGVQRLAAEQLATWRQRYDALIAEGRAANPPLPPPQEKRRGRPKQSKAQNLLDRLELHADSVLAFLYDFSVPFTNNLAEQDLRMSKVQQKISGCFRTFEGARTFACIRSYVSTLAKNDKDILEGIADALRGHPFIPEAPA